MDRRFSLAAAGALGACAIAAGAVAADKVRTLSGTAPGLWEMTGVHGAKTSLRECLPKLSTLGQFEHRARTCTATTLSDDGKVMLIDYTCGGKDFGRTSIKLVTPRNLRVETQGISEGLPFSYTIEARRVGECKTSSQSASERGH